MADLQDRVAEVTYYGTGHAGPHRGDTFGPDSLIECPDRAL